MWLLSCNFIVSEEDLYFPALPLAPMIVYNLIEPSTFFHLKALKPVPFTMFSWEEVEKYVSTDCILLGANPCCSCTWCPAWCLGMILRASSLQPWENGSFSEITGHGSLGKESWAFHDQNYSHPGSNPFLDRKRGSQNCDRPLHLLFLDIIQLQNLDSFYTSFYSKSSFKHLQDFSSSPPCLIWIVQIHFW